MNRTTLYITINDFFNDYSLNFCNQQSAPYVPSAVEK